MPADMAGADPECQNAATLFASKVRSLMFFLHLSKCMPSPLEHCGEFGLHPHQMTGPAMISGSVRG